MFKRVAKATSKKAEVEDLKDATGDDTAIGIDRLVDESSSSEGEDSEDDDDDDSDEEDEDEAADSAEEGTDPSKAGSKRKRAKEDEANEDALAQVSIDDAIQDPIYVPTEGEKKHGVFASRCIVCEAAVLKTPHLVTAHLEGKAHKRRMERFQRYVQEHVSEAQRKTLDARDAVDQMDDWKAEQEELERQKVAEAPLSKRALAKKAKAAEFRKKKKEQALKRKAQKEANGEGQAVESKEGKTEKSKREKSSTGTAPNTTDAGKKAVKAGKKEKKAKTVA